MNLKVPENTDFLTVKFSHIKTDTDFNGLILNLGNTKGLVLHFPHSNKYNLLQSLEGVENGQTAKLIEIAFKSTFDLINYVYVILVRVCSQRIFLLKQLDDQGMPLENTN